MSEEADANSVKAYVASDNRSLLGCGRLSQSG